MSYWCASVYISILTRTDYCLGFQMSPFPYICDADFVEISLELGKSYQRLPELPRVETKCFLFSLVKSVACIKMDPVTLVTLSEINTQYLLKDPVFFMIQVGLADSLHGKLTTQLPLPFQ